MIKRNCIIIMQKKVEISKKMGDEHPARNNENNFGGIINIKITNNNVGANLRVRPIIATHFNYQNNICVESETTKKNGIKLSEKGADAKFGSIKKLLLFCAIVCLMALTVNYVQAQTYHSDDKEGLRIFLRQQSAEAGKINAEQLGLQISDTLNWQTDETWVTKIENLTWNGNTPKRLIEIVSSNQQGWREKNLAGILDGSKWINLIKLNCCINKLAELNVSNNAALTDLDCSVNPLTTLDVSNNTALTNLSCYNNQLSSLDVNNNPLLTQLSCRYNQLTELNVSNNTALKYLDCSANQLTALNLTNNIELINLDCQNNRILLSDLYNASEILENNNADIEWGRALGNQILLLQLATIGIEVNFPIPQNVFNGIYTEFTVTKNTSPAETSDYSVTDGKITFNTNGNYTVIMTNAAIISSPYYPAKVTIGFIVRQGGAVSFHPDDKEGLRAFLRQSSAVAGKINAEQLGLQISDTLNWQINEQWILKIPCIWNEENPMRLFKTGNYLGNWESKNLAGTLNASKWTKLEYLDCYNNKLTILDVSDCTMLDTLYCYKNQLTALNLSNCTSLTWLFCTNNQLTKLDVKDCTALILLECFNNQLTSLDVSNNIELRLLNCNDNQLTKLDVSNNTKLVNFSCYFNHLLLSDLYIASVILENNNAPISNRTFGNQTIPAKTATLDQELTFPIPQNIFNGIYTEYTVTQDGNPVNTSDYTVNSGNIMFHKKGTYSVTMSNESIISKPSMSALVTFDVSVGESGINDNILSNIKIFPNPTTGIITVKTLPATSPQNDATIRIYDISGRIVQTQLIASLASQQLIASQRNANENEFTIDISDLQQGMYYFKIGNETVKIIKN